MKERKFKTEDGREVTIQVPEEMPLSPKDFEDCVLNGKPIPVDAFLFLIEAAGAGAMALKTIKFTLQVERAQKTLNDPDASPMEKMTAMNEVMQAMLGLIHGSEEPMSAAGIVPSGEVHDKMVEFLKTRNM